MCLISRKRHVRNGTWGESMQFNQNFSGLDFFTFLREFVATESIKLTGPISKISTWWFACDCTEEEEVAALPSRGSFFRPQVTAWLSETKATHGYDFHLDWIVRRRFAWNHLVYNHSCWHLSPKIIDSYPVVEYMYFSLHHSPNPCWSFPTCLISVRTCSELAK